MNVPAAAINSPREGKDRLERYYTRPEDARRIVRAVHYLGFFDRIDRVIDPTAGARAFGDAVEEVTGLRTWNWDLAPGAASVSRRDAFDPVRAPSALWGAAVLTNPPFSIAMSLLEHLAAHGLGPRRVGFLLPSSWIGTNGRRARLRELNLRPHSIVNCGRMKFGGPAMEGKKSGGAAMHYYLIWWERGRGGEGPACAGNRRAEYYDIEDLLDLVERSKEGV